ncbi:MAG: hypothetical protein KF712_18890 [Akkermansiaceae bacterium]|nr:hypothetical protein [Akkermansiaceae bacterium]
MAIYGAGSKWDGEEVQDDFFSEDCFTIGWNRQSGADLQSSLASLKIGDIIYLKSNQPGSRSIRVKGIGIVARSFIECIQSGEYPSGQITSWESFFIRVCWVIQNEFIIEIPEDEGRMTNIRAATFYEEPLPFVQQAIVSRLAQAAGRTVFPLSGEGPEPEPRALNLTRTQR